MFCRASGRFSTFVGPTSVRSGQTRVSVVGVPGASVLGRHGVGVGGDIDVADVGPGLVCGLAGALEMVPGFAGQARGFDDLPVGVAALFGVVGAQDLLAAVAGHLVGQYLGQLDEVLQAVDYSGVQGTPVTMAGI